MRKLLMITVLGIILILGGCRSGSLNNKVQPEAASPAFRTLVMSTTSGCIRQEPSAPRVLALRTSAEYAAFWHKHTANTIPAPTAPEVDFAHDMVIVLLDRMEMSGGYAVEIVSLVPRNETLVVKARRSVPGSHCAVTDQLSLPCHMITTDKSDAALTLKLEDITIDCSE